MSKNDHPINDDFSEETYKAKSLDEYDRLLEDMEVQIKELKKIKKRKKKMMELELEKEEIIRKMNKDIKNKRK